MKTIARIITCALLVGCSRESRTERIFPGDHIVRESIQMGTPQSTELSIWKKTSSGELLVCRIVSQSGRIVSIMPTPVQTDAIRATANFVEIGNGWTGVLDLRLDERGKMFRGQHDTPEHESVEFGFDRIDKILKLTKSLGPVYLTVEQNTELSRFEEVFKKLANSAPIVGVGWKQGWW